MLKLLEDLEFACIHFEIADDVRGRLEQSELTGDGDEGELPLISEHHG